MASEHISIVRAAPTDAREFSRLVLLSGKLLMAIYDNSTEALMAHLYAQSDNLYSYTNSCFLRVDEKIIGMLLAYSQITANNQQQNTKRLMIEYLGFGYYRRLLRMIKAHRAMGSLEPNEYMISNIAIAPEFRNRELGKILIQEAVRQARQEGCSRLVLDVTASNIAAIRCYEKSGFVVTHKRPSFKMNGRQFTFYRMNRDRSTHD
jgi:ribosomal protein S18 acetylase RimI-like enzyme